MIKAFTHGAGYILPILRASDRWVAPAVDVAARFWMASVFFKSGLTKTANWDNTLMLFEYEYGVPILPTEVAAYMATAGELILPWLLVFGFGARIGALGLLVMTLVIEFLVYPGTTEHYYWMLLLGAIAARGPGLYSVDAWLRRSQARRQQDATR